MTTCFYTIFDNTYKATGEALVRSIKRFYPDIPVIVYDFTRSQGYSLRDFCGFHLEKGMELLSHYDRVISVDCDSIFCSPYPDLFGDYALGVVQNNIPVYEPHGGDNSGVYINAGLDVCTSKEVWKEYMDEFTRRCNECWNELNEQNALNHVFHTSKHDVKLLEYPDRVYGITAIDWYPSMTVKDGELWVRGVYDHQETDKKLCVFHAAGTEWKDKPTGRINFNLITNVEARETLKGYTL
jgi:hypothetical protein